MKAISVLFGGCLGEEAFVPLAGAGGKRGFSLALERARDFPFTEKVTLLGLEGADYPDLPGEGEGFSLIRSPNWTRRQVLECLSRIQPGFDLVYFAWADCPFLDPALAGALAERHTRYAAEYSYADGFPYGFAPELLSSGVPGILFAIDKDGDVPVERDALFQVIQKDINAFDIETEISPVDLRQHRLCFAADSRRNLLLISRWLDAAEGVPRAAGAAELIEKKPGLLRTLPAFYNIQISEGCPQTCSFCPWPLTGRSSGAAYMEPERFNALLDKIEGFSSDAVISFSLWGEPALHPEKMKLINMVLERPSLSLVVETSGIGWKTEELEALAKEAAGSPKRRGPLLPQALSWIVSLDAFDPSRYKEIRGPGFGEAAACAKQLLKLFPGNAYVQALRVRGAEDDIEGFYRFWKEVPEASAGAQKSPAGHVIIQKYDHFCGKLPRLQASDLSPIRRRPCWHLSRDMCVALDGRVLRCREDLAAFDRAGGLNVFIDPLEEIWKTGEARYLEHARGSYPGECADCDEYYTYNF